MSFEVEIIDNRFIIILAIMIFICYIVILAWIILEFLVLIGVLGYYNDNEENFIEFKKGWILNDGGGSLHFRDR